MDAVQIESLEDFRAAMRGFAATVTIVTANDGRRHHGMTATSVTSLSMDPPSLLICLNQQTLIHDIMLEARFFNVNVLRCGQEQIAGDFAGKLAPELRFQSGSWPLDERAVPYLEDAKSVMSCRKAAALPFGTHTIIVGVVERVRSSPSSGPLVYSEGRYCAAQRLEPSPQ